jgi:hypothetical protein
VMTWAMIGRIISVIILSVLPRTMKCEAYRIQLLWFTNSEPIYQDKPSHKYLDLIHQSRDPVCYTACVCPVTYLATHKPYLQRQCLLAGISG